MLLASGINCCNHRCSLGGEGYSLNIRKGYNYICGLWVVIWGILIFGWQVTHFLGGRLVVLWSQVTTGLGVVAIICYSPYLHYSTYQYVVAAILIFVSTNILEGTLASICPYLQGDLSWVWLCFFQPKTVNQNRLTKLPFLIITT